MLRRVLVVLVCMTVMCWCGSVFAQSKEELKEMHKAKASLINDFYKKTMKPLMTCYRIGLQNYQQMLPTEPDRNQQAVDVIKECTTKYTDSCKDEKIMKIKGETIDAMMSLVEFGNSYVANQRKYDKRVLDLRTSPRKKQKKIQEDIEKYQVVLESQKKQIKPMMHDYKELFKKIKEWKKGVKKEIKEIESKL